MIALNETNSYAAEVPVFLPLISNPLTGLTGKTWHNTGSGLTDEFTYLLPGGTWSNATIARIIEKGFGRYALRLLPGECTTGGIVFARATDAACQPCVSTEAIGQTGGDFALGVDAVLPFYLANAADPVFGSPVSSHTFSSGEVKIALPNASYVSASISDVLNFGQGSYGLLIHAAANLLVGKIYLHVVVSGAQTFDSYFTMLGVGSSAPIIPPGPPVVSVQTNQNVIAIRDHVANGILRLPQYARFMKDLS